MKIAATILIILAVGLFSLAALAIAFSHRITKESKNDVLITGLIVLLLGIAGIFCIWAPWKKWFPKK